MLDSMEHHYCYTGNSMESGSRIFVSKTHHRYVTTVNMVHLKTFFYSTHWTCLGFVKYAKYHCSIEFSPTKCLGDCVAGTTNV